jgi:protein-L-isoaspartate O-methyltransferase
MPLGSSFEQSLTLVTREGDGFRQESLLPVNFVPLTGRARAE